MAGGETETSVSAIIPAYNAEAYIREAIDSVLDQSAPVAECIVVDDGSTDETVAQVRRFGGGVRLIEQANAGPGAARNRGAAEAAGDLLAFLDADDRWRRTRLSRQVDALALKPHASAVVCATEVVDRQFRPLGVIRQRADLTLRDMLTWRAGVVSTGSNLLITRDCFAAVGGFDEHSHGSEDWLMTFQLVARRKLTAIDDPLVQYRVHDTNLSSSAARLEREMLAAYDKVFSGAELDPEARALRRKAYANLHRVVAGAYFVEGDRRSFAREATKSLLTHPSTLLDFVQSGLRRVRGQSIGEDPFAMARGGARRT